MDARYDTWFLTCQTLGIDRLFTMIQKRSASSLRPGEPFDSERWPTAERRMDLGSWPLGRGLGFYLFQLNGWAQQPAGNPPNFKNRTTTYFRDNIHRPRSQKGIAWRN